MGLLTTDSFLFCLPLKVGGLVLGALSIVVCVAETYETVDSYTQSMRSHSYYSRNNIPYSKEFGLKIALYQLQLLFAGCWLYGIFWKKATWMLAYLIYNIVVFGALLMYYIVFIASFFFDVSLSLYMGVDESRWSWIILITLLPATVLAWHFVSVMYSLFQNIRKEHRLHPSVLYAPTTEQEDAITITTKT